MYREGPVMPKAEGTSEIRMEASVPANRARLIVEVPEDAKLYIDDQLMKTTSARRNFSTPDLEPGQTYYYMLRVEVTRDNTRHSETRRVLIRPGQEAKATFTESSIVAASQSNTTASK
jgi:uncharacterized protein (TIGR03000 family)